MKEKYEDLKRLNEEYGTVFWSQEYQSWDEIPVPKALRCEELTILDYI